MIGIIIAMQTETNNLLQDNFQDVFTHNINGLKFYVVKTKNGFSAVICFSGIGKVNATMYTSILINSFNINQVINIGSSGIISGLDVLDALIVDKTCYSDVDVTAFGYEINQVPKMPLWYETNNTLNHQIKQLLDYAEIKNVVGVCSTADSFINSENIKKYHLCSTDLAHVIDMECCAIAQTCYQLNVCFNAIKIGIDKLYQPQTNQEQFNANLKLVAQKINLVVLNIIDLLSYNLSNGKDKTNEE